MKRPGKAVAIVSAGVVVAIVAAACSSNKSGSSSGSPAITGAGSTFAQPFYSAWALEFQKIPPNAKVNYQAIGSGGGIQAFANQTVAFGASDVPAQSTDVSTFKGGDYVEFPTALGGVAVLYNLSGAPNSLKLDGATTANIFLGKIKTWNDSAIKALNPGVNLPNTPISVVHRADESGTTKVFTGWLSDASPTWSSKVGSDKAVQWPVGQGANGSSGVAAAVKQTNGAIGYASQDYAVTSGLSSASIKAKSGSYISPTVAAITAAGACLKFPIQPTTTILNCEASGSYPIATTTFVLVYTKQSNQTTAQTLVDFWHWGLTKGQAVLTQLNYAPLPSDVAQGSLQEIAKITYNGQAITPTPGA